MKRTPLRLISKKRASKRGQRQAAMDVVRKRDCYCCQAKHLAPGVECCNQLDGHEIVPRSHGGDWINPDDITLICRRHHDWIHGNPVEARRLGLLLTMDEHRKRLAAGVRLPRVSDSRNPFPEG